MFDMPGGHGFQGNPFSVSTMMFKINAVHDSTGSMKEGVMSLIIPHTTTELQVRKHILDMAYSCGWRLKELNRIDNRPLNEQSSEF
jgi:hypothetical protein